MGKREKQNVIEAVKQSMTETAQKLHTLTKKRKEIVAQIKEKDKQISHTVTKDVGNLRDKERQKRLQVYGGVEQERQQITSALLLELMQICQDIDVPSYVLAIAKILDNYQGNLLIPVDNWFIFLQID